MKRGYIRGGLDALLWGNVEFLLFQRIGETICYKHLPIQYYAYGIGKWPPEGSEGVKIKGGLKIIKLWLKIIALPPTF